MPLDAVLLRAGSPEELETTVKTRQDLVCVIVDSEMLEADRMGVARRLCRSRKRRGGRPPVPVVLLSGHPEPGTLLQGCEEGQIDYLPSPPNPEILRARVQTFLELAEPDIPTGAARCIERGATSVRMLPYFLSMGRHVAEHLDGYRTRFAATYPNVSFTLCPPLGVHPKIVEVVLERLDEI